MKTTETTTTSYLVMSGPNPDDLLLNHFEEVAREEAFEEARFRACYDSYPYAEVHVQITTVRTDSYVVAE